MSNQQYTRGPWEIWNEGGGFGGAIGIFAPDDKDVPVATTCANTTQKGMARTRNGQTRANALLIAAAPELLEALQAAVAQLEHLQLTHKERWPADTTNLVSAARVSGERAIAKATGK
jgi:NAD/NADP transhydrogenase alpha subunit